MSIESRALLCVESAWKFYGREEKPALADVSLEVGEGELVALVGHNGAGKTTLFNLAMGVMRPSRGSVSSYVGVRNIGWCPQRDIVDWSLTARQNIELGACLRLGGLRAPKKSVEYIAEVLQISDLLNRQAEVLSGGELRRCQIARALVGDPALLMLDEPSAGLDPDGVDAVFSFLSERAANGRAVLVSTHDTSRFAAHCDRVVALQNGRLIADEPVREFMMWSRDANDLWKSYLAICESNAKD